MEPEEVTCVIVCCPQGVTTALVFMVFEWTREDCVDRMPSFQISSVHFIGGPIYTCNRVVSEKQKPPMVLTISLTMCPGLGLSHAPNASPGFMAPMKEFFRPGLWRPQRRFGDKESPTGGVSLTVWKEDAFGREIVEVEERRGKGRAG